MDSWIQGTNQWFLERRDVWEGSMKQLRKIKRYKLYQLPIIKIMSDGNTMFSVGNPRYNIVITLYGDR